MNCPYCKSLLDPEKDGALYYCDYCGVLFVLDRDALMPMIVDDLTFQCQVDEEERWPASSE